ncbi:hypothetical protein H5T87_07415 [bacterium]|nr:hypothetical protein [bacterium]
MKRIVLFSLLIVFLEVSAMSQDEGEYLFGYLIFPIREVDRSYNAGFSMYVPAWQLLRHYPGHLFQSGLPGTWMFAQYDGPAPENLYSDVEGGLGWWRDTRFPTETPKFIMGGVGPNFSEIANGPAHGWGSWEEPRGLYGVAQLSPWLLFPIDGLNIKQGASGELFGYGYLALPLTEPKEKTDGKDVPTGNNCWTLFLNTKNFKGPVAFFTPYFWSHHYLSEPRLAGQLLDSRPAEPNRAVQMETQWIPCRIGRDKRGEYYAKIAEVLFPLNHDDVSVLLHRDTVYNKGALWECVESWFSGGPPCEGKIDERGACLRQFREGGYSTWEIRIPMGEGKEKGIPIDWNAFASPLLIDEFTYGYKWNYNLATKNGKFVVLPQYYRLENKEDEKRARWVPITPDEVPAETGLLELRFERPVEGLPEPYTTPDDPRSCWKQPGPVAGPFKAYLGDGSVVTYYWFRFADQPALLNAGLTKDERERMQERVERIHRMWTKDREYLPPPTIGELAELDPAQLVMPPKGLEVGYVPIATRQELAK